MPNKNVEGLSYAEKIDYYANSSDLISVNNGNRKTGLACLTFSFPRCSCDPTVPCMKPGNCYCEHFPQSSAAVQGAYWRNWRLWHENPDKVEKQLDAIIELNGLPLFRYCDCGDFPDDNFALMTLRIAEKHPDVNFLAYTKKYAMINAVLNYLKLPENLTIRMSHWDKAWEHNVENPHNLPEAFVKFKNSEKNLDIPKNAFHCKGGKQTTCSACKVCFMKQVQYVYFDEH